MARALRLVAAAGECGAGVELLNGGVGFGIEGLGPHHPAAKSYRYHLCFRLLWNPAPCRASRACSVDAHYIYGSIPRQV